MGRRKKPTDRLSQHAKEATDMGLSYGRYMSIYHPTIPEKPVEVIPEGERKVCAYCGKVFRSKRADKRYCCDECRHEAWMLHDDCIHTKRPTDPNNRPVMMRVTEIATGEVETFASIQEAQDFFIPGQHYGLIAKKTMHAPVAFGGYLWERVEE